MNDQPREHWEPVARVVFKKDAGFEPRIVSSKEVPQMTVCTASRVLRFKNMRAVSLDLVESFDVAEKCCGDCHVGLGYPLQSWRDDYPHRCRPCNEKAEAETKRQTDAYTAERDRKEARRKELLAAMGESDRELFRR